MSVYVALLRGINVGGKHKLPMQDLVAILDGAGFSEARTYIQSGNAVFRATEKEKGKRASQISAVIETALFDRLGFQVPVVIRTADELRAVANANPFLRAGTDEAALHVMFLTSLPVSTNVATLDPNRSPPDRFALNGRKIYLHCPNGLARTKLTNNYFDAKLATTSTIRNWKTVLKLVEMSEDI